MAQLLEVASKQEVEAAYRRGVEDGICQEGARFLARICEAINSWQREPDEYLRGMVQATLECLAVCITSRGVNIDEAIAKALARLQLQPDTTTPEPNS
jgi:mannitol-1-phosphate/altronate dehydrogenase